MAKQGRLHVLGLKVQDLRNIDLIEVDFTGHRFIEINGQNGAAKSTLIDSLFLAMMGPKYLGKNTPGWRVIKKGANKAMMKVTLGNKERTIEIKRSITKKEKDGNITTGNNLSAKDMDGNPLTQAFLDDLLSEFTVDPVSFSMKPPKQQIDIMKQLGGIDTTELETERDNAYQERTIVNREVATLKALVAGVEPDLVESVDTADLMKQLEKIEEDNRILQVQRDNRKEDADKLGIHRVLLADIDSKITEYEQKLQEIRKQREEKTQDIEAEEAKVAKQAPVPEDTSPDAIRLQIANAQDTNAKATAYSQYQANTERLVKAKEQAQGYTDTVDAFPEKKRKLILSSDLPFKNIDFDENVGLVINDVPFNQKSDAEKIRISTRVGMELKPDLRIICIKEGSMLDEKSYEVVKQLAVKYGYQVLVESVGERQGEDCIVMRSGSVISQFEAEKRAEDITDDMEDTL